MLERNLADFDSARRNLYDATLEAAQSIKPFSQNNREIRLADVGYDAKDDEDSFPDRYDYAAQADALTARSTLGRRLRGTWQMYDTETGKMLEQRRALLAVVPRVNEDGTMIYRGSRYAMLNQQRVKPSLFARVKKNEEVETHVNVAQGTGTSHRYILNPETGQFSINVGHSRVPLAPFLRLLGTTDDEMRAAWGDEIAEKNFAKNDRGALQKLYEKLVSRRDQVPGADPQTQQLLIQQAIANSQIDPWSTERTTGIKSDRLSPAVVLAATKKVLALNRQEADGDDRDHLAYQTFHTVEDLLPERIRLDRGSLVKKTLRESIRRGSLSSISPRLLQQHIQSGIFESSLGVQPEFANPLDGMDRATRLTKMGEGGLSSLDAVPLESRDVHMSQMGFVDGARTVECGPGYMEVMTDHGWMRLDAVTKDYRLACLIDGRLEFHHPTALQSYDFDGELQCFRSQTLAYELTGNHRMWVACHHPGSKYRFETADAIAGKHRLVMCGGHAPYIGENAAQCRVKSPEYLNAGITARKLPKYFSVEDWAEFMGWYLGEGSTGGNSVRGGRNTTAIAQCKRANPENWERINALLLRMGLKFSAADRTFQICNTHLASYMMQFNGSGGRYVPEHILELSVEARRRFLEAIMLAEACTYKNPESGKRVFHSSSLALAEDVQFIAFTLGYSTNLTKVVDDREERYLDGYRVTLHTRTTRTTRKSKLKGGGHSRKAYKGKVYCATVPGGLMYWRMPGKSGFWLGNSLKTGIDTNLVSGARRGADGRLRTPVINQRTGQLEYKSPEDLVDSTVAFSDKDHEVPGYLVVSKGGQFDYAKPEEVDYILPNPEDSMMSHMSNLVPGKNASVQNRLAMGTRMIAQALPLREPEAPWVQSAVPGSNGQQSYEDLYSNRVGAIKSLYEGTVKEVQPGAIIVTTPDGDKRVSIHKSTPLGSKTRLANKPIVKPGDKVTPGQLLATSNFTNSKGTMSLGRNARVALMPWGDNYEDAFTISRSFADRLASDHAYRYRLTPEEGWRLDKKHYIGSIPSEFKKEQLEKLDDKGVIQVGQLVRPGDPLILAAAPKRGSTSQRITRKRGPSFQDQSLTWDQDVEGIVEDVRVLPSGDRVVQVTAAHPTEDGDKIADRYGAKGVVTIVPDEQMIRDKDGNPFDVVASDLGLISRSNAGRAADILLGKVAAKRGKPIILEDFDTKRDLMDFARQELEKEGIPDMEEVFDPRNGRKVPKVLTGNTFIMKLHHMSASKSQARGVGRYTCFDEQTEVLTRRGWIGWEAADFSDEFATVDATGRLSFERPVAIVKQPYDGELCGFRGKYVDYLVTPNHRMWVRTVLRSGRGGMPAYSFVQAEELPSRKRAGWVLQQGGLLPDAVAAISKKVIPIPAYGSVKRKTFRPVEWDFGDYAEFCGWFISEGSITYNKKSRSYEVQIAQVRRANPENFARIESLLRRLELNYSYTGTRGRDPKTARGFRIRSKQLFSHLKSFGSGCENKRITRELLDASYEHRLRLLEALMAGDGSYREEPSGQTTGSYETTSKQLADDLQELLLRVGLSGSVTPKPARNTRCKPSYVVGLFLTRSEASVMEQPRSSSKFYRAPYAGKVYCATVPSGLLITRRNGKVMISGNSEGTPAKGGDEGSMAKRLSNQEMNALMAHQAYEFIREGSLVRGQRNEEYWSRYMNGHETPTPTIPEVYRKFHSYLRGIGVNPVKEGTKTKLMLLSDKDTVGLAGSREVRSGETVDANKDLKPIAGGLFDTKTFGDGTLWGRYQLSEAMPHPLMEDPIRKLMGVTKNQYRSILSGEEEFGKFGSGPDAIRNYLSGLNVNREVEMARAKAKDSRKTHREAAVVRLRYLRGLQDRGVDPKDMMIQQIPILPPTFRPVSKLSGKDAPLIDGMNLLYRDMIDADKALKGIKGFSSKPSAERLAVYDSIQAAMGLREPVDPELRQKKVTGLMGRLMGQHGPKTGFVQRKLLSGTVDLVGRGVIAPSTDLHLDEVGIPEGQAWETFKMPVLREMRRQGRPLQVAMKEWEQRSPTAKATLERMMEQKLVAMSRAPVLHKFGMLAYRPKLIRGNTIRMNPLVYQGYAADNDGDQVNFHVILGDKAVEEAKRKWLPSRTLLSPRDFKTPMFVPNQDHALGLYRASVDRNDEVREKVYATLEDAKRAFARGEINIDTPVRIMKKK